MQLLAALPDPARLGAAAALALAAAAFVRRRFLAWACLAVAGLSLGALDTTLQAGARLSDELADIHHDKVTRLALSVVSLPQDDDGGRRFLAEARADRPQGIPARIRVAWHTRPGAVETLPEVLPGQVWRMALVLRRPHGLANPDAPDAELRDFVDGVRADGTVRGKPELLDDDPWASPGVAIERLRHRVRAGMRRALEGSRYGPVLIALAIGDQAGVAREDWRVFNRTGISHLVSISGSHITLVAAAGGMLAAALWRRARWRGAGVAEYLPARLAGGLAALGVALGYCLLAGWGVPARRTFFMLAVLAAAGLSRLPLDASRILLLAGACVAALDPWAPLAPGFWLSFGAVAILMRVSGRPSRKPENRRARLSGALSEFVRVQGAITLGLTPLLAFLMHQVSLGSPLANAIAIPLVGAVVTPLALLCGAFAVVPGAAGLAWAAGQAGQGLFAAVMLPVGWIGRAGWSAIEVVAAPWPLLAFAALGLVWALQAPGLPWRGLGWLCALPLLCWRPERPAPGEWFLAALDVGQGSALVLETATRVLVYDTGPRYYSGSDAGERVLVPYLRARGARALDTLVVSHADLDHAGGLPSLLESLPVAVSYAPYDIAAPRRGDAAASLPSSMRACEAGTEWEADGVLFRFVSPPARAKPDAGRGDDNARSCVLLVQGRHHSILLPGDAGTAQEARYAPGLPAVDVVAAPHHGSASSSGAALVRAAGTAQVIVQAGYLNHFHHPAAAVAARWRSAGATLWRTDLQGAVFARSQARGLQVWAQREAEPRYWRGRP